MLKQAFHSYWKTLFSKTMKEPSPIFVQVYFFILIAGFAGNIDNAQEAISLVFKLLPYTLLGRLPEPQLLLPKAMFLCPMKESDRREYVQNLLRVKIGVPVIVSIVLGLIHGLLFQLNLMYVLFIAFVYFSMGISITISCYFENKYGRMINGFLGKDGKPREAVANILNIVCSIFFLFSWEMFNVASGGDTFVVGYMIVGFVIMSIFDLLIIKRKYEFVVREACNYELSFNVKKVWE